MIQDKDLHFLNKVLNVGGVDIPIYIFGAGQSGDKVYSYLTSLNLVRCVRGFIDNDISLQGVKKNGGLVYSLDEVIEKHGKEDVFIIIASLYHGLDISKQLASKGVLFYYDAKDLISPTSDKLIKQFNKKPIVGKYCLVPFDNMWLYRNQALTCCPQYINYIPIGNPQIQSLDEIWNSPMARQIRQSIIDGTYCFCNFDLCSGRKLVDYEELDDEHKDIIDKEKTIMDRAPKSLHTGVDPSCNLRCKMCRPESIHSSKERDILNIYDQLCKKRWDGLELISANGAGELFFGDNDLRLLESIDEDRFPDLKTVRLASNGVLFTEEKWNRIDRLADKYKIYVAISVDATTRETYDKIRIGGSFESLKKNLEMLSVKRIEGRITYLEWRFCVQKDNWKEMKSFAEWGKRLQVDRVWFQILQGGTVDENVSDVNNSEYENLKTILEDPIFHEDFVDIEQLRPVWDN
ncbi:MAG: radical SAM protein [Eubacterium sp.]|nr:radical SAM protein [Eubacterium sp.]